MRPSRQYQTSSLGNPAPDHKVLLDEPCAPQKYRACSDMKTTSISALVRLKLQNPRLTGSRLQNSRDLVPVPADVPRGLLQNSKLENGHAVKLELSSATKPRPSLFFSDRQGSQASSWPPLPHDYASTHFFMSGLLSRGGLELTPGSPPHAEIQAIKLRAPALRFVSCPPPGSRTHFLGGVRLRCASLRLVRRPEGPNILFQLKGSRCPSALQGGSSSCHSSRFL